MVKYLLTTFHTHDEEIETIHLPIVFAAIMGLLSVSHHNPEFFDSFSFSMTSLGEITQQLINILGDIGRAFSSGRTTETYPSWRSAVTSAIATREANKCRRRHPILRM